MLLAAQRLADNENWDQLIVMPLSIAIILVCFIFMQLAFRASAKNRESEGASF
jgi:hypothetical protein